MAREETIEVEILDKAIHCAGCEARIQSVLSRLNGVKQVKADHKTQKVHLTVDSGSLSLQNIREKLDELGYRTAG